MDSNIYGKCRDTKSDTWSAIDRQGRRVWTGDGNQAPVSQKKAVGIFYWSWHGIVPYGLKKEGPFDVSKILENCPEALDEPDNPAWGENNGQTHHWGESVFGYYLNDDEYVIRKHAQLLCDAGVDFIAFDTSNFQTKKENCEYQGYFKMATKFLLDTYIKIRAEGKPTPQVTFICPFFTSDWSCVEAAYKDFYIHENYMPLWYKVDKKPLMLYNKEHITDPKILDFFTFRRNMPEYHLGPTGTDQWPWLEIFPQHAFYSSNDSSQPEIVSVGVAQNSVVDPNGAWRLGSLSERDKNGRFIARGRSFHDGAQPQPDEPLFQSKKGYNFQEQWNRAFELDPKCVFITGWNEWIMGRWAVFKHYEEPMGAFVDQFNSEFSRDIEPMRGNICDDFYYQMVDNIRRFKGIQNTQPIHGKHNINIKDFSSWECVDYEYLDDEGDALGRHHPGYGQAGLYYVQEGKNDFISAKVAHNEENLFFYIRTKNDISRYLTGFGAWMQLFISINNEELHSWEGFNFTVNRILKANDKSVLEVSDGGWNWKRVSEVDLHVEGNQMSIKIPLKDLHMKGKPINVNFKWIDSMNPEEDILELYTHGDTAPNGRFAYVYKET